MVIKGSSRGHNAADVRRLARHLMDSQNETVSLVELRGCGATDLAGALTEMRALSLGSRTVRCLYSASINVAPDEQDGMTPARWRQAVDTLEKELGLTGHQRAVVRHRKAGADGTIREHTHVVWGRVHPVTLKAARDGWSYRAHERAARKLEAAFGQAPVLGVHSRPPGTPRPVAAATHKDQQAAARTGVAVRDVADTLKAAWARTGGGPAFAQEIAAHGLQLARGRRGIVVIDPAGTPHSLARRLGVKAAAVRAGLRGIHPDRLPDVGQAKRRQRAAPTEERTMVKRRRPRGRAVAQIEATTRPQTPDWDALAAHWAGQGFITDQRDDGLWVQTADGAWLHDQGDRITLFRDGDPTDDDNRLLIEAARARGWQGIRFTGGTPEWQRRARDMAIQMGYPPEKVSIECEDSQKPSPPKRAADPSPTRPPVPAPKPEDEPMPEHLARRLGRRPEPDGVFDPAQDDEHRFDGPGV